MKLSLNLGTYFGIPVNVHWSFSLLLVYVIFQSLAAGAGWQSTVLYVVLVLLIFVCVVLHEYGHALAARRYGVETKDITLLPIGGIARLERLPDLPKQELIVAIAGPLVNIIIAVVLMGFLLIMPNLGIPSMDALGELKLSLSNLPIILVGFNLIMVAFNLIPAFPMDGGRILRSLLAMKFTKTVATKWAAHIGQFISVLFVIYGLYQGDYILAFIGVFIFMSASREHKIVAHNAYMNETDLSSIMRNEFTILNPNDNIPFARNRIAGLRENFFVVVDENDKIVGYVSKGAIENAESDQSVSNIISYLPTALREHMSLAEVSSIFQIYRVPILPVFREDKIIGVVELA
ncbi:MAG: site-2 protease family protein [Bacteroidia bacterium]|nr:site-2 protease family protein [Bacteroidia bacterium]